jgi:hypothetical protein
MLRKRLLDAKLNVNELFSVWGLLETLGSWVIELEEEGGLSEEPLSKRTGLL